MPQKKNQIGPGDTVVVTGLRQDSTGEPVPEDVVGKQGAVQWVTPGYAGEKTVFEIKLDDGRIVNLYATEIEPVEA